MKKLKIFVLILIMIILVTVFGNYSFANDDVVTLNIEQGRIKITPTGYSIEGGEEIKFDGQYVITGTRSDVDILEINNETGSEFNVDVTLKNTNMLSSSAWGTMFVIRGNSPVNIDLAIVGNCTIQSQGWAPIYSQNDAKVKMIIDDTNGNLSLENRYIMSDLIMGTRLHVENQNGDVLNKLGQVVSVPQDSLKLKSEATCEENEIWTYICPVCGEEEEREIKGTATGHDYEPTYNWREDGKKCTLNLVCKNDKKHIISDVEMKIEKEVLKEPTCTEKGITKYTATATVDGVKYQDSIEKEDIEATEEHNYIEGVCSICGKKDPSSDMEEENKFFIEDNKENREKEEKIEENINNPKTSDSIYTYIAMLIISLIALTITFKMKANKK